MSRLWNNPMRNNERDEIISTKIFLLHNTFLYFFWKEWALSIVVYLSKVYSCTYHRGIVYVLRWRLRHVRDTYEHGEGKEVFMWNLSSLIARQRDREDSRCLSICRAVTPLKLSGFPTSFFFLFSPPSILKERSLTSPSSFSPDWSKFILLLATSVTHRVVARSFRTD